MVMESWVTVSTPLSLSLSLSLSVCVSGSVADTRELQEGKSLLARGWCVWEVKGGCGDFIQRGELGQGKGRDPLTDGTHLHN
jgi:hypothetical protein